MSMMYDAIVLGIGGMGSAAAFHLARRGARVLGLERFAIPHDRGSSHGVSRIIRLAYWEHPDYVPLVRRAHALWRELEGLARERLLIITGSIDAGPPGSRMVVGARTACETHGLAHDLLDSRALTARFPGYRLPDDFLALHQPDGGFLLSERCIVAHARAARASGADIRVGERVSAWHSGDRAVHVETDRGRYEAARLVITAGPWLPHLAPALAAHVTVERQVVLWTRPTEPAWFAPSRFPVFYMDAAEGAFYGFPDHDGHGFKIGKYHHRRQRTDADALDRHCDAEDERVLRDGLARYFPAANGPRLAMSACLFTNTPDEHFIIDTWPGDSRVLVAGGFSGHGFKFCSVVGEILAGLALDGRRDGIDLFRLGRSSLST
jgi:sarcosine oxidase